MNRTRTAGLVLAVGVVLVAGWSGAVDGASASVAATGTHAAAAVKPATKGTITIKNYDFSGPGKNLAPGARVTVKNLDSVTHTVTSGHAFSVKVGAQKTVSFKAPKKAGKYKFHCSIHPFMTGSLTVK